MSFSSLSGPASSLLPIRRFPILDFSRCASSPIDSTLATHARQLWGQYYRDVLATPDGTDHQNIRNFMKNGWDGVDFYNGISLTKKTVGDAEWDWHSESFIP